MPRSITLPRLDPAQSIDLDGTLQSPELVLDGIKADDFGELELYEIVGEKKGIFDRKDLK